MSRDFSTYPREELINIIRSYEEGTYAMAYEVCRNKLNELLEDFGNTRIDVTGDGKEFENYIKFQSALGKLQANLDDLQKRIDPTIEQYMKEQSVKPKEGTPEYFAMLKNKK